MEHILVIDVGTSSLKAMLYDRAGNATSRLAGVSLGIQRKQLCRAKLVTWKEALLATLKQTGEFLNARGIVWTRWQSAHNGRQ